MYGFHTKFFTIFHLEHLNKSVLQELEEAFNTINGQLSRSLKTANNNIDTITEEPNTSMIYMG